MSTISKYETIKATCFKYNVNSRVLINKYEDKSLDWYCYGCDSDCSVPIDVVLHNLEIEGMFTFVKENHTHKEEEG